MKKKHEIIDPDLKFEIGIAIVLLVVLAAVCVLLGIFLYNITQDTLWAILTPILCVLVGFVVNIILKAIEVLVIKFIKRS